MLRLLYQLRQELFDFLMSLLWGRRRGHAARNMRARRCLFDDRFDPGRLLRLAFCPRLLGPSLLVPRLVRLLLRLVDTLPDRATALVRIEDDNERLIAYRSFVADLKAAAAL